MEETKKYQPRYSGPNRSGLCLCTHRWDDHHLGCVMNAEYYEQTGEAYVPEECEFHGFNETGGLGPNGEPHCGQYRDTLDTEESPAR
jgi:hypothetical protein